MLQVLENNLRKFPKEDQLTPKHLVQWINETLQITNVPDFTFDDVTYKIENMAFWSHLQSNIVCVPHEFDRP